MKYPSKIKYSFGTFGYTNYILAVNLGGICALMQDKSENELVDDLKKLFPKTPLQRDDKYLNIFIQLLNSGLKDPGAYELLLSIDEEIIKLDSIPSCSYGRNQTNLEDKDQGSNVKDLARREEILFKKTHKLAEDKKILIELFGTDFQKNVWLELCKIPFGKTSCYSDIALRVNNPKGARAIAQACGANPISVLVPCHRVIGKNGKLTGYRGGLHLKKALLDLEDIKYSD